MAFPSLYPCHLALGFTPASLQISVLLAGDSIASQVEPHGCAEIADDAVHEYMLSYNRTTTFKDDQGDPTRGFEVHWRAQPQTLGEYIGGG
jgi:hypothetical protein